MTKTQFWRSERTCIESVINKINSFTKTNKRDVCKRKRSSSKTGTFWSKWLEKIRNWVIRKRNSSGRLRRIFRKNWKRISKMKEIRKLRKKNWRILLTECTWKEKVDFLRIIRNDKNNIFNSYRKEWLYKMSMLRILANSNIKTKTEAKKSNKWIDLTILRHLIKYPNLLTKRILGCLWLMMSRKSIDTR